MLLRPPQETYVSYVYWQQAPGFELTLRRELVQSFRSQQLYILDEFYDRRSIFVRFGF